MTNRAAVPVADDAPHILIVDDDNRIRALLQRYLSEHGFDVTGFYPVSRDRSLRLVEFDCVMINRAAAA